MDRYTGIMAAAFIAKISLEQITNLNHHVIDADEDSIFAMQSAIRTGFMDQLDNSVTISLEESETLVFKYPEFALTILFPDGGVIDIGCSGAIGIDVYNSQGRLIGNKDPNATISKDLSNRALNALQDKRTLRKF